MRRVQMQPATIAVEVKQQRALGAALSSNG